MTAHRVSAHRMSAHRVTAFRGHTRLASGPLRDVARRVWRAIKDEAPMSDALSPEAVLLFDDATGRVIDLEMRGGEADMLAHLGATWPTHMASPTDDDGGDGDGGDARSADVSPRGRGRPKLGVVAREITMLPRHWEWLATQPGGASVALRRLVEAARRTNADADRAQASRDAAYKFLNAMAGDLPQFEEVIRALYRDDAARYHELMAAWPADVGAHAARLAFPLSALAPSE